MNYLVTLIISEIHQQYEAMAVQPTEEILAKLAEMEARTAWQTNLCIVLGAIGLALSIYAFILYIREKRKGGRHC